MAVTLERTTNASEELEVLWEDPPGLIGFFTTVDHKRIGIRYIVTALIFLVLGGLEALVIRAQLASPEAGVVGPETYNQLMTMHGTTMIFLFNTPILSGFGNYLVPLQIGARDMAFPRLNALSYWIYVLSGIFLYGSFLTGRVPDGGWFGYVPLTGPVFSPGKGIDFWALGITFLGISTTVGGINFIVTIFRLRAPGMSFNRIPIFTWSVLVMAFMILFALPAITLAEVFLELDRIFATHFYDPAAGGSALLYQHLFWFWGHPEVYILVVPATGMVSAIIPIFVRRRISGYTYIVASLVSVGFISFGVWVHHMFATGLPTLAATFFSAASLLITIPSGVQFFAWLRTIQLGKPIFSTPFLFALGFLFIFLLGGFTGVMVGVLPFDWQVTDSYFVVAHFHYVLVGGVVFPVFGALYHWFPKLTGRMTNEKAGRTGFWLMFIGFNVTFFPQHFLGLMGMPRRVYTYQDGLGWNGLNLMSTLGGYALALGFAIASLNLLLSRYRGQPAPADPWGGDTLEWATSSPPPEFNFARIPEVRSRHPLWEEGGPLIVERVAGHDLATPAEAHHEVVATTVLDAEVPEIIVMPEPSWWPLLLALSMLVVFVAALVRSFPVGIVGFAGIVVCVLGWLRIGVTAEQVGGDDAG
jgi:cytochrome c oxidase subunit 1/cytochrome c oxidase subunit I+III